MNKTPEKICTKEHPCKEATIHTDGVIRSREEVEGDWPVYECPHCGFRTTMPEWNTLTARKMVEEP